MTESNNEADIEKENDTQQTDGGRWGRSPYKPEDLKEKYGTNDSGSGLSVVCPGCEREWYPLVSCCVHQGNRTSSPFCQYCGVDFRADPDDVNELIRLKVTAQDDESAELVRKLIEHCEGLVLSEESTFYRENKKEREKHSVIGTNN